MHAELTLLPTERHVERAATPDAQTPRRFFDLVRNAARPERRVATLAAVRMAALAALLDEPRARPPSFERARAATVASALADAVGTLREAGATAADVLRTGPARGRMIAAAYERTAALLAAAGLDDPRGAPLSDVGLAEASLPRALRVGCSADLSGGALAMLVKVHATARRRGGRGVVVALPRMDAIPAGARFADALERRLASLDEAPEIEWHELPTPAETTVIEARSIEAEARAIAERVAAAIDAGSAPERIAIAVPPRDEAIAEPLRAALAEAGVPFSEAYGPPVDRSPEARAALSLLEMARGRLRRDAIVELLGTPGAHAGSWVAARDEATAIRRAAKVSRRLRELPLVADANGKLFVELLAAAARDADEGFVPGAIERLAAAIGRLRSAPDTPTLAELLATMIVTLRLGEPSAEELGAALANEAKGRGVLSLAAIGEGAVAVRAVLTALEDFRAAATALGFAADRLHSADLATELDIAVRAARTAARGAAGRAGAVRVGPPREIVGLEHDLVIATRMVTRAWSPPEHHGILDEDTRERIDERVRPSSHRERTDVVDLELAWALASARQAVMTFTPVDDEGRDTEPPHDLVKRAIAAGATKRGEPASRLSPAASAPSGRARELVLLASGAPPPRAIAEVVAIEAERARFFTDPAVVGATFSGRIASAQSSRLRALFGGDAPERPVGVTRLELAASCPFRAFAQGVLGAQREHEAEDALSPRERGNALHRALEAAFDAVRALPPSATDEARIEAGTAAIAGALELDAPASALRRDARERTAKEALAVLVEDLGAERDAVYAMGERAFGRGGAPPWDALALPPDAPVVFVAGQMDRIDLSPDQKRARVVDYKSGAKMPNPRAPGALQLRLYSLATKKLGPHEITSMYVGVGRGGAVKTSPARSKLAPFTEDEIAEAVSTAVSTATSLWDGNVEPRPRDPRLCRRCEARDVCRRPAVIATREDDDDDKPKGDGGSA